MFIFTIAIQQPSCAQVETAKSVCVMNTVTGKVVFSQNADERLPMASTTKIMTLITALLNSNPDDVVKVSRYAAYQEGSSAYLKPDALITMRDLCYGLMLNSGNDAAVAIAEHISQNEEKFALLMNDAANKMGVKDTNFVNPNGLHDDNHYTTAYDMALIAMEAMNNATFSEVWGNPSYIVNPTSVEPDVVRIWNRHNMLVSRQAAFYSYAKGGKTGYTDEAGRTLVTYASRDGRNLMCVVMKSGTETVYDDTRRLFEYGFTEFQNVEVKGNETRFGQSEDSFFVSRDNLFGDSSNLMELTDSYVTIPAGSSLDLMGYELTFLENDENGHMACIKYKIGDAYLGQAILKLNVDDEDKFKVGCRRRFAGSSSARRNKI